MGSTLHWGTHYTMDRYNLTRAEAILVDGSSFADDFHTYGTAGTRKRQRRT